MRTALRTLTLILTLCCICLHAQTPTSKITVTGKLDRVMAIGAESTGWAIQPESNISIDGKSIDSIQVSDSKTGRLESLENKRVRATGKIAHRNGVETGNQPFLQISSIKEDHTPAKPTAAAFNLSGSEWLLEDLDGTGVIDNAQATLSFPEKGKIAGKGSCNRFFGTADISGDHLKFGALGSTRMACPEAIMNQESKYLAALQASQRFEWKDPYLLIYYTGSEKPLRFTRTAPAKPANH
jgi:heat shock protein HslJ